MTPGQFVQTFARQPFMFGSSDCACMIDAWVGHRTGRRPAQASGQRWTSEEEAAGLLRACTLPLRLARGMRALGLRSTRSPQDGDVAAIAFPGPIVTCAIRVGEFWMFRHGEGICGVREARVLMAWRVA